METALYLPVKRFLENLGFAVKGEVGGCDLVALSDGDPPVVVIGELKIILQSRTNPASGRSCRGRRRSLACRQNVGARQGARKRRALSQSLPPARLRHARGHQHRRCRGDRQAADHRAAPQSEEALAPGRRASAPQGRSGAGRQHPRADHDGLPPAGAGLRLGAVAGTAARARSAARIFRTRRKSCCTMSTAGSIAPSAASTC